MYHKFIIPIYVRISDSAVVKHSRSL